MASTPPPLPPRARTLPKPPPLPFEIARGESLRCLFRCKVLNLVMGSLFLLAVFGSFAERHMHGEPPRWDFVIASVLGAFWGFTAAYLLHRRRPSGYLASFPCLLFMLAAIPLGTVFGILGLTWLNKGRSALTEP